MSKPHVNTCKNCGVTIIGNYCENCGQKAKIGKVTFQETFQDIFNAIFAIDAPFITTLKMLIINMFNTFLGGYLGGVLGVFWGVFWGWFGKCLGKCLGVFWRYF